MRDAGTVAVPSAPQRTGQTADDAERATPTTDRARYEPSADGLVGVLREVAVARVGRPERQPPT